MTTLAEDAFRLAEDAFRLADSSRRAAWANYYEVKAERDELARRLGPAVADERAAIDRVTAAREQSREAVLAVITGRPGGTRDDLRQGVRQIITKATNARIDDAVSALLHERTIHVTKNRFSLEHHLGPGVDS